MNNKHLLSLNEIKETELNILLAVREACNRYGLRLYLNGGTLLGAIRHKGFIPWDDDIDVFMPRPDYNRFIELSKKDDFLPEKYKILSYELGNYPFPYTKVIDTETALDRKFLDETDVTSLWIDITAVEGLSSDPVKRNKLYRQADIIRLILLTACSKWGTGTTFFARASKLILIPLCKLVGVDRCSKWLHDKALDHDYSTSDMVGCFTWGLYGKKEAMPRDQFEKSVEVEFEKHTFNTMSCWDTYLHNLYGDYMQLPPENKRTSHEMEAWKV